MSSNGGNGKQWEAKASAGKQMGAMEVKGKQWETVVNIGKRRERLGSNWWQTSGKQRKAKERNRKERWAREELDINRGQREAQGSKGKQ